MSLARQFVGPTAVPFRATLFDKSADRNWLVVWHQDTALPLRAHPLRVLRGTHERGVLTDSAIARLVQELTPIECLVPAGRVVAMRPLLLDASTKAASHHPRRVLHIEYPDSLHLGDGLELALA